MTLVLSLVPLVVLLMMTAMKKDCPQCGTTLPTWRTPDSVNQALFGGWTCPCCRASIDRFGKAIEPAGSECGGSAKA